MQTIQMDEKAVVRAAIDVAVGHTAKDLAARMGISQRYLYSIMDPALPDRAGPERLRALADIFRNEAARMMEAAERLDQAADEAPPLQR